MDSLTVLVCLLMLIIAPLFKVSRGLAFTCVSGEAQKLSFVQDEFEQIETKYRKTHSCLNPVISEKRTALLPTVSLEDAPLICVQSSFR